MQKKHLTNAWMGIVLMAACLAGACASPSYINVRYQLAPKSNALQGKRTFLKVTDARTDTRIFDAAAHKEFTRFNGTFALALAYGDEKGLVAGAYDLPTLFQEALRKKLQDTGVEVLAQPRSDASTMMVNLNEFLIGLNKSKWVATISYSVSLSADPKTVAHDTISGSAERVKVMGSGAAEKVLGDIFSDSLNRLDVVALFDKAGL
jgi:uncharacterized lipoprotein YajG